MLQFNQAVSWEEKINILYRTVSYKWSQLSWTIIYLYYNFLNIWMLLDLYFQRSNQEIE